MSTEAHRPVWLGSCHSHSQGWGPPSQWPGLTRPVLRIPQSKMTSSQWEGQPRESSDFLICIQEGCMERSWQTQTSWGANWAASWGHQGCEITVGTEPSLRQWRTHFRNSKNTILSWKECLAKSPRAGRKGGRMWWVIMIAMGTRWVVVVAIIIIIIITISRQWWQL